MTARDILDLGQRRREPLEPLVGRQARARSSGLPALGVRPGEAAPRRGSGTDLVLRGPRQVGKTTIQEQLIESYLADAVEPRRLFRVQFDEPPPIKRLDTPILAPCRWFENRILGTSFNQAARAGRPAYIFLDEVQTLDAWAPQLKALVDHHTVRVLVTGSSALRIEAGRDSLAGRISELDLGPLLLREIAELAGHGRLEASLPDNGLGALLDLEWWKRLRAQACSRETSVMPRCATTPRRVAT
jgi:predicted AAA+ superfamily ATPase